MGGFLIVNGNFFLWFLIYFEGSDTIKLLRALLVFGVACLVSLFAVSSYLVYLPRRDRARKIIKSRKACSTEETSLVVEEETIPHKHKYPPKHAPICG